jgi:lysophospholipase L1-like esterase
MRKFNFSIFQPIIIAAALVLAGSVNAALFGDGVHPNHAGYEVLGRLIHGQVVQILG